MNTPRTDAFEKQRIVEATTNDIATEAWADFARQLERDNERLREALKEIADESRSGLNLHGITSRLINIAAKALSAQPEEKTK